jgi:hypothetical protein
VRKCTLWHTIPVKVKVPGPSKPQTLTFADAITRFGKILNLKNLEYAYRKAGKAFRG